jgi:hypothetical protein
MAAQTGSWLYLGWDSQEWGGKPGSPPFGPSLSVKMSLLSRTNQISKSEECVILPADLLSGSIESRHSRRISEASSSLDLLPMIRHVLHGIGLPLPCAPWNRPPSPWAPISSGTLAAVVDREPLFPDRRWNFGVVEAQWGCGSASLGDDSLVARWKSVEVEARHEWSHHWSSIEVDTQQGLRRLWWRRRSRWEAMTHVGLETLGGLGGRV